jgi:hypothetical protein
MAAYSSDYANNSKQYCGNRGNYGINSSPNGRDNRTLLGDLLSKIALGLQDVVTMFKEVYVDGWRVAWWIRVLSLLL